MLLALLPIAQPAVMMLGAGFIKESGKALKDIEEGEFNMVTTSDDGTVTVRMLAGKGGARITVTSDQEVTNDIAVKEGRYVLVDHTKRVFSQGTVSASSEAKSASPGAQAENTLSLSFDTKEGLVFRSNPTMENIRRWSDGNNELFTGNFGKGESRNGSFHWERNAKTKLPKRFECTFDGRHIDVVFRVKERHVSTDELTIPANSYRDYGTASTAASGL